MDEREALAERFEQYRGHLHAVAYRMLGSLSEADDAVQETWIRLHRADTEAVQNLAGWLTTVVSRVCLDLLRTRKSRREQPLDVRVPDPIVSSADGSDPEYEAELADSVGLALLVVLDTLAPAERLAFVLHDLFGVPFAELAPILERTPAAAKQLASRARRRLAAGAPVPDTDLARQREVVEAFLAAARAGDFDALVAVLDPGVVLRADAGTASGIARGARAVAGQALRYAQLAESGRLALVNGAMGIVNAPGGRPVAVLGCTIVAGKIVEIDVLADPERLARLGV